MKALLLPGPFRRPQGGIPEQAGGLTGSPEKNVEGPLTRGFWGLYAISLDSQHVPCKISARRRYTTLVITTRTIHDRPTAKPQMPAFAWIFAGIRARNLPSWLECQSLTSVKLDLQTWLEHRLPNGPSSTPRESASQDGNQLGASAATERRGSFQPRSARRENVNESPTTRATLLLRLRDISDHDAWSQFLGDYGPMLYRFVRSRGLQDADASDLVQEVLRSVGTAIGRLDYRKEKGGFRAWLFTITRNKLYSYFEKKQRTGPTANDTAQFELLNQAPATRDELQEKWEEEHQRVLAAKAMETVKAEVEAKTWTAFELTAIDGLAATEAATRLAMSSGAVYVARSRVTARLRNEVERLLAEEDLP